MAKENAFFEENERISEDSYESFDLDELEEKFQNEFEEKLDDLEFLKEEKEKIGNPDNLGKVIMDVVWDQFLNQVAVTAGEDFIKENNGLRLDLRNDAHIQTTENFAKGKIATHNKEIDYQKRYDDWQNNFQRNNDGTIRTKIDNRTGEEMAILRVQNKKKDPNGENYNTNYNARKYIDKGRPQGSKTVNKDHTISAAEIIRDAEANAHMTREEQASFANSDKNLIDLDSRANESKQDSKMSDWLDSERNGEKPADRFPINEDELRKRDKEARDEYEKQKAEAEQRSIKSGKKSQKEEAFRIGGKALRAVIMQLLAELIREIIAKLVKWFKSAKKAMDTLLNSLREAIHSFIGNLKTHLINAGNTLFSTVATAIIGPVFGTIKKVWMMLKQGWQSLRAAVSYIRKPENKGKSISRLILETGKIVIAGLTGVGAIALGEVIEKGLMSIPIFAFEIPLLGSLANLLGIFFGAVVAGIIGAIAINLIEKKIEKSQKAENVGAQIEKRNDILNTQHKLRTVNEKILDRDKSNAKCAIRERHAEAADIMRASLKNIGAHCENDKSIDADFENMNRILDGLEGWKL
jgi:hypothetical protein